MFTQHLIIHSLYPSPKLKGKNTRRKKRLHEEGRSSPRYKARRNSLVDGSKETNCSIPSEIVYRRGRQLNRNFIFHSNIVTSKPSRNSRITVEKKKKKKTIQSVPRKSRERNACFVFLRNFKNHRPTVISMKHFPLPPLGYARKKKRPPPPLPPSSSRRFQRHKGADLTSAFFPRQSARIFITEETGH